VVGLGETLTECDHVGDFGMRFCRLHGRDTFDAVPIHFRNSLEGLLGRVGEFVEGQVVRCLG
jgi:hypothetical protein